MYSFNLTTGLSVGNLLFICIAFLKERSYQFASPAGGGGGGVSSDVGRGLWREHNVIDGDRDHVLAGYHGQAKHPLLHVAFLCEKKKRSLNPL